MQRSKSMMQSGFTMIELLISMAIGLVIVTALTSTFVTQRQSYDIQQQITAAVQTARAAMDMMSRELRLAGYDPADVGIVGIPYSADQLRVLADLDGDGLTTGSNEDIIYKYDSEYMKITRNTGGVGQFVDETFNGEGVCQDAQATPPTGWDGQFG